MPPACKHDGPLSLCRCCMHQAQPEPACSWMRLPSGGVDVRRAGRLCDFSSMYQLCCMHGPPESGCSYSGFCSA